MVVMNFKEFLNEKTQDMVSSIARNNNGKIDWDDPNPTPNQSGTITFKTAKDASRAFDKLEREGVKCNFASTTKITFSIRGKIL